MYTDISTYITRSPDKYHGQAVIAWTRVPVMVVVALHKNHVSDSGIVTRKSLSFTQVWAALAYYYANQALMDREIAEEAARNERLKEEYIQAGEGGNG